MVKGMERLPIMASIEQSAKKERRTGFDRRQYEYNAHIPERRLLEKRRIRKKKKISGDKRGSSHDKPKCG
jgi:hypothetical protein